MSTERHMLDLLRARYGAVHGNGHRYACAAHVRSHAGFDARRTADFIAMDLWPSSGLTLHGHEVKTSRSDWLAELKCPEKSEEFKRYMDRWWLVVPDAGIVRDDLPHDWGLMVAGPPGLRVARAAPRLAPAPLPKSMLACLLRAVVASAALTPDGGCTQVPRPGDPGHAETTEPPGTPPRVTPQPAKDTRRTA